MEINLTKKKNVKCDVQEVWAVQTTPEFLENVLVGRFDYRGTCSLILTHQNKHLKKMTE